MTRTQADKITELIAQGYVTLPPVDPSMMGGPVEMKPPSGPVVAVLPDGTVKPVVAIPKEHP